MVLGKLKLKKKVKIVDGDNRVSHTPDPKLKRTLESMIDNDMSFNVIQIFHYASIHYETKWDKYPMRFLTALSMSSSSIKYDLEYLALNDREEPELKGGSSEILALGLSIMFMCKWYQTNFNKFEKIEGSEKRCDYRFNYNKQIIVFEVRGRSNKKDIKKALRDCVVKKANTSGDIKYSTICHLPRDESPVTLNLYDPPVDNNYEYDEYYPILKHYRNICEKVGLTILSEELSNRIKRFEEVREWSIGPIEMEGVIKLGIDITIGNQVFWSRNVIEKQEKLRFFIQFGLEKRVIEALENWDLNRLKEFYFQENVHENDGRIFSILSDGSLFYIGEERLNEIPNNFVLNKKIKLNNFPNDNIEIKLTWEEVPKDLDLYLFKVDCYNKLDVVTSYKINSFTENGTIFELSDDVRTGLGPEILNIRKYKSGNYLIAVHNYSEEIKLSNSNARIELRINGNLERLNCPTVGEGNWWIVAELEEKIITIRNEIAAIEYN